VPLLNKYASFGSYSLRLQRLFSLPFVLLILLKKIHVKDEKRVYFSFLLSLVTSNIPVSGTVVNKMYEDCKVRKNNFFLLFTGIRISGKNWNNNT